MKKIEKLRLTEVAKQELTKKQLKDIKGGDSYCVEKCGYISPDHNDEYNFWVSYF